MHTGFLRTIFLLIFVCSAGLCSADETAVWTDESLAAHARRMLAVRRRMANDPHRPIYHFTAPRGWMNDPNGPIYWRGEYHLFYQHDPPPRGSIARCWAHAVSNDLVRWRDLPIAMYPDTPYDSRGVYSGNIVINDDGVPTALYTGSVRGRAESYGMMATSTDGMITWKKRLVIEKPPYEGTPPHWDAQAWKDGDTWYQLTGGCWRGGGAALLWSSPNLVDWTFRNRIYTSKRYGPFWELPYLLPFGKKQVLMVGTYPVRYWTGKYDKEKFLFTPDRPDGEILDYSLTYYAPDPHLVDEKGPGGVPRRIMLGWIRQGTPTKDVPYWEGMHGIPRILTLKDDGTLVQTPLPEFKLLRGEHFRVENRIVDSPAPELLRDVQGDALEIIARFDIRGATAERFGVNLRMSSDRQEKTTVYYAPARDEMGVDGLVSRCSHSWCGDGSNGKGPAGLSAGEPVTMHVFLDRSVVEVFVNGRSITERMFPKPTSQRLDVFADGGHVRLESIDIWRLKSIWPQ